MSTMDEALAALSDKMGGQGFANGTAKFEITGLGALMVDADGVRIGEDEADVTLRAEEDVFKGILSGDVNPTTAFMTGKLSVDGDMGLAMKLASVLG